MAVTTREMRPDELPEVFRLYGEAFGSESLAAFQRRYDWEFRANPRTAREPSRMYLAIGDEGQILGHIGSFPMLLKCGAREVLTSSSGDLFTVPAARGMGVGETVSKAYRDGAGELATDGFGYQPVTGRIYKRLGYHEVQCVPVYMRPLRLVPLYRFALGSGRLPSLLSKAPLSWLGLAASAVAQVAVSLVNFVKRPSGSALRVGPATQIGADYDALWARIAPEYPLVFVRDSAWLRWRFEGDPISKHTLLEARSSDGVLQGYLAYSISDKPGMRVLRLMDLFCSLNRGDVVDALVAGLLDVADREGVAAITCWGMHPRLRAQLKRYLYLAPPSEQQPTLLYCTGDAAMQALVYDSAQWHATRADGDEGLAP